MITQANSYRIPLKDNSIHSVITSFPYYGLRLYDGVGPTIWGGDSACSHVWGVVPALQKAHNTDATYSAKQASNAGALREVPGSAFCQLCGAWLGCFGLEPSISLHVQNAVAVCREIKRVLRPDGVFWLNYGDSYATSKNGRSAAATKAAGNDDRTFRDKPFSIDELPAKSLCGIPWRVALALQDDGWILRADVIWSKPNPMPESVNDRPTKSHEYIFMLVKSARYFYDAEAIREAHSSSDDPRNRPDYKPKRGSFIGGGVNDGRTRTTGAATWPEGGRNRRTVWTIATQSFSGAHFATFPTKLVEPMVLASTSARGVCPKCGAGWLRVVEKNVSLESGSGKAGNKPNGKWADTAQTESGSYDIRMGPVVSTQTTGWRPGCDCIRKAAPNYGMQGGEILEIADEVAKEFAPIPAVILDPFCGSGTCGEVARNLGRRFIGLDLSATYLAENALPRSEKKSSQKSIEQLPMFAPIEA